jgi:RNA polymerase sigma factor (TIGR02999 family)
MVNGSGSDPESSGRRTGAAHVLLICTTEERPERDHRRGRTPAEAIQQHCLIRATGRSLSHHLKPAPMLDATPMGITRLLRAAGNGDRAALDTLFTRLYAELRDVAHWVRRGRSGETMNTTAVVHEAYVRLARGALEVRDRGHFFALAARAMRQVLVDAAREAMAEKRGGGVAPVTLGGDVASPLRPDRLLALDSALDRLAAMDERQARIVECRFFAGLSVEETAEVLGVSTPTVKRDWRIARAWIAAEMDGAA